MKLWRDLYVTFLMAVLLAAVLVAAERPLSPWLTVGFAAGAWMAGFSLGSSLRGGSVGTLAEIAWRQEQELDRFRRFYREVGEIPEKLRGCQVPPLPPKPKPVEFTREGGSVDE